MALFARPNNQETISKSDVSVHYVRDGGYIGGIVAYLANYDNSDQYIHYVLGCIYGILHAKKAV